MTIRHDCTKTEFQLYQDADISDRELDNARRLLQNGEITEESFSWLCGMIDLEEDVQFHRMTAKQKRRYFAQQAANRLGGYNLFGRPSKLGKPKRRRKVGIKIQ